MAPGVDAEHVAKQPLRHSFSVTPPVTKSIGLVICPRQCVASTSADHAINSRDN